MQDRVRVYFSERDVNGKSFIRFVDLELDDPTKIIGGPSDRVLENGKLGSADADGQIPSFAWRQGMSTYLYYSGWTALQSGAYHNSTMLARSGDEGQSFWRMFDGPILDRTPHEPYLAVTPCLVNYGIGHMWYVGGLRWENINGKPEPIYAIHFALLDQDSCAKAPEWVRHGIAIPQAHPFECHSRPWVNRYKRKYRMWYCHRSAIDYRDGLNAYRLGYATSADGWQWKRQDDQMHLPRSDFDTTMQCYPAVFEAQGKVYLLYNGNTFGKHGFGLAVAE